MGAVVASAKPRAHARQLSVVAAADNVAALLEERAAVGRDLQQQLRLCMAGAHEWNLRWLLAMRRTSLPREWVFDSVLANARTQLQDPKMRLALTDYLAARLRQDLPILVKAQALSVDEAAELKGASIDNGRAWAALRAADMFTESERLEELRAHSRVRTNSELVRALTLISKMCEHRALIGLSNPPVESCTDSLSALALAHGYASAGTLSPLYERGVLARHRQLLAQASGLNVDAPILVSDFGVIGAACGDLDLWERIHGRGVGGDDGYVWLNESVISEQLADNNDWSHTLTHELVHTLQGWEDDNDIEAMSEWLRTRTLVEFLCEGATDAYTQTLLRGLAERVHKNGYAPHRVFVHALASALAYNESGREEMLVQLALCADSERLPLAASLLYDTPSPSPSQLEALREVACAYAAFVYEQPAPVGGVASVRTIKRSAQEMRVHAEELLRAARMKLNVKTEVMS